MVKVLLKPPILSPSPYLTLPCDLSTLPLTRKRPHATLPFQVERYTGSDSTSAIISRRDVKKPSLCEAVDEDISAV